MSPTSALSSAQVYDSSTGTFTSVAPLAVARYNHTATLLPNGKVLIVGGQNTGSTLASAELYDPAKNSSTPTGSLTTARTQHTATLLPDGRVLVTGGISNTSSTAALSSAEIYDPTTGTFTSAGSLTAARSQHTATLLNNGKVLIAGGSNNGTSLTNAELYDPVANTFTATSSLTYGRYAHTATVLNSGQVLLVGGINNSLGALKGSEIYDPATNTFTSAGALTRGRFYHTTTLLPSGKVLVAGGENNGALDSTELYDPSTNTFSPNSSLTINRYYHTATLLPNGKVLIVAGSNFTSFLASAELYDPIATSFPPTQSLARARDYHTATLLPNGKVLIIGGRGDTYPYPLTFTELYDPATKTFSFAGTMLTGRYSHTATLLPNGKVLIVGGYSSNGVLSSAELYDPSTGVFSTTGSMANARSSHTATLLPSGKVLITGGSSTSAGSSTSTVLSSAELYDPATGTFAPTGPMTTARTVHKATLLSNNKVLITGGVTGGDIYSQTTTSSAELYDPATGTFVRTGSMNAVRSSHTATLLNNGQVLIIGGNNGGTNYTSAAIANVDLYNPGTGTFAPLGTLLTARFGHTATLLDSGLVLVTGGVSNSVNRYLSSAELYDPSKGTSKLTGAMIDARAWHTATLLNNGTVLVVGGTGSIGGPIPRAELYSPNNAPVISSLSISPNAPTTASVLKANIDATDPEGDAFTASYLWKKNGQVINGETGSTLDLSKAGNGDKGDVITVVVTLSDSPVTSRTLESAPVTVVNSAPNLTAVSITPQSPLTDTLLTASVSANDPDGDALTYAYKWERNGVTLTDETDPTLDLSKAGNGDKGDIITLTVTASDGTSNGEAIQSAPVTVGNSAPVIASVTIDNLTPKTNDTLTATPNATDSDGDSITYTYQWTRNGVALEGETKAILDLSKEGNGDNGDQISVTVTANDGIDSSQPFTTEAVTVGNIAPSVSSITLNPKEPKTDDPLTATVTASDADGDNLTYTYTWTRVRNGQSSVVRTQTTGDSSDTLVTVGSIVVSGDIITVSVVANDGTDMSSAQSDTVTIGNTPVRIENLKLTPTVPKTNSILVVNAQLVDADGGRSQNTYIWTKTSGGKTTEVFRETTNGSQSRLDLAKAGMGDKGDVITVTLTASDGQSSATKSASVKVANSLPTLSSLKLSPTSPTLGSKVTATFVANDLDVNDGVDVFKYLFSWKAGNKSLSDEKGATVDLSKYKFLKAGDTVSLELRVADGTAISSTQKAAVKIGGASSNSAPSAGTS